MHVPMSRSEIAMFLETTQQNVEQAWQSNALKRTVFHEERLTTELAQSSIFDVLEYALAHDALPVRLSKHEAAMWVLCLCEACEWEDWSDWQVAERASQLMAFAADEGIAPVDAQLSAKIAMTVIVTQGSLLGICLRNDALVPQEMA